MKNLLDTPEFRNWFRDSKIVDGEGRPLRLFHGTRSDVRAFDASKSGEFGPGIYLTDFEGTADWYASVVARGNHGPNIMPVYASIQNPFTVTKGDWVGMTMASTPRTVQKRLISKGYDGIIGIGINGVDRQIVAFRPDQVKSAISNKGAFDPSNTDITEGLRRYIAIVEGVMLDEIVVGFPVRDTDIQNMVPDAATFSKNPVVANVGGLDVYESTDAETVELALMDGEGIVAFLIVARQHVNGRDMIQFTYVSPKHRGQGRMRSLIDLYTKRHGPVLSDSNQSPEAQAMWKSLMMRPGALKFRIYDAETDTVIPIQYRDGEPVKDPWDDTNTTHILVEGRVYTKLQQRLNEQRYRKTGLSDAGWYGYLTDHNP